MVSRSINQRADQQRFEGSIDKIPLCDGSTRPRARIEVTFRSIRIHIGQNTLGSERIAEDDA
jgi:hypothetical protein